MRYLFWLPIRITALILQAILAVFGLLRLLLVAIQAPVRGLPLLGLLIQLILLPIYAPIVLIYTATSKLYMRTVVALDLKFGFATPDEVKELIYKTPKNENFNERKPEDGDNNRHYVIDNEKLLAKYGDDILDENTGQTYQQAWDSNSDGNWRYGIRVKLLKKEGIIK